MKQREVVDGLREERERAIAYLRGIAPEAWERPSLCQGWRVRDVAAHLAGNVADVLAQRLEGVGSEEYNRRQVDERAARSPQEILDEWEEKGPQVEQFLAGLGQEVWEAELPQIGATVGSGTQRLLEDLWVHAHDMRLALGEEPTRGAGLTATLEVIAAELAARCRRLAPGVAGVEIAAGDFAESVEVAGDGATVRVEGDPATLALVGTGRIPLERAAEDGRLSVAPAPPRGFADALNVYGP